MYFVIVFLYKQFTIKYIYSFSKVIVYQKIDENSSDGLFLFNIGVKRNFKSGCAICLTDKIMGTTCLCGHTLCANPCFSKMMKSFDLPYLETTKKIGDKKFIVLGKQDISNGIGMKCPLCRCIVKKSFRIEDTIIHFSHIGIGENEIDKLIKEIDEIFDIY